MLGVLLRPLAWLPLAWLHALGAALGWLVYGLSGRYRQRLRANLRQSGVCADEAAYRRVLRAAVAEAGKGALELFAIWLSPTERLCRRVRSVEQFKLVEAARDAGRGVLFLTPHMGCFEITAVYAGHMLMPITVLYRRPRRAWLETLLYAGRARGRVSLAATDLGGVRRLLRALRAGEAVGLLPDQAPRFGEGVWAPFFGRPAFTMTLANRLRRATGCATFMVFAERLARGQGYRVHVRAVPEELDDEVGLNRAVEDTIRICPEQYLWGYDRYKIPPGVDPPAASGALIGAPRSPSGRHRSAEQ